MKHIESFFFGIIAALGALVLQLIVFIVILIHTDSISSTSFFQMFTLPQFIIIAACTEETLKYLVISKRNEMVPAGKTAIINSFWIGLGFFSIELALLATNGSALPSLQILTEIAMIHIGTAGMIGYFAALKSPRKILIAFCAIFLATVFHGIYNLLSLNTDICGNYMIFAILGLLIFINIAGLFSSKPSLARD